MKKLFSCLITLILLFTCTLAHAETFEVEGIYYETIDNNLNVNVTAKPNGQKYSGNISIKGSVQYTGRSYSVKGIGKSAFAGCTGLTSIQMDNTIESIEDAAFQGCTGLTSVEIPNRTTFIGVSAFEGCTKLGTVTLSTYLTTIKNRAFAKCSNLSRVDVQNRITAIGDEAFLDCAKLSTISLPAGLKTIGNGAFQGCTVLSNVDLGSNLIALGSNAFTNCKALRSVTIPDNIKEIKAGVFSGCETLSSVGFPEGLTVISANAFSGTAFPKMEIPATVKEIGDQAFNGCKLLIELKFLPSSESIKYGAEVFTGAPIEILSLGRTLNCAAGATGAFRDQKKLKTLDVLSSCIKLPDNIFRGCTALVNVTVEGGLREISPSAFESCEALQTLMLPETVELIGANAFSRCYVLSVINLPKKVDIIEMGTFYMCRQLKTPDLSNVTEIQNQAFYGCDAINGIAFSEKLTTIGNDAFGECLSLSSVSIPGNVTTMGDGVFFGCSKLTSAEFKAGSKLLRMGDKVLAECPVREFVLGRDIEYTGKSDNNVFGINTTLYEVEILSSVTRICDNMFDGCEKLTEVTLPESVNKVGTNAFGDCPALISVTSLNESAPSASAGSFSSTVYKNATLTVPETAVNAYKSATGWKNFSNIKSMPGVPKYTVTATYSGSGSVMLNGLNANTIEVRQGSSLTIVAEPESGMIVKAAGYTMGGRTVSFSRSVTIPSVTADVDVNVEFGDEPSVLPTSISLSPETMRIGVGETARFYVNVTPLEADNTVTWSLSSGSGVVSVASDGEITGLKNGMAQVTAKTVNGLTATASVIVDDGSSRIEEIPDLQSGQKWQAKLIVNNAVITSGVTWTSSNSKQLPITSDGLIQVKTQTSDEIYSLLTAKYGGNEYYYDLYVNPGRAYEFKSADGLEFYSDYELGGAVISYAGTLEWTSSYLVINDYATDEFGYQYPVVSVGNLWLPDNVTSLTLPATLKYISTLVSYNLKELYVLAMTPPAVDDLRLGDDTVVYVPADALSAYKNNNDWKYFNPRAIGNEDKFTYTVYFNPKGQTPKNTPCCYIWCMLDGMAIQYTGVWPGAQMSQAVIDGESVWKYVLETDSELEDPYVIFNDKVYQTPDLQLINNGLYGWNGLIRTVTGIKEIEADAENAPVINGMEISAHGAVAVYAIDGTKIAEGIDTVNVSAPGLYVVVTESGATKVMIR